MAASKLSEIHPATRPHMPHELVSEILSRLPAGTLQRFRCVCKAWRDTISDDQSFLRAHLRHQRRKDPWLLIAPEIELQTYDLRCYRRHAGWYRWEEGQSDAPVLVYAPDSPWVSSRPQEVSHKFAHCDGLVLVPRETTVRVINPATRRVLELPLSHSGVPPAHQTFGLGHDPRSDSYKVVRLFRRSFNLTMSSSYNQHLSMEVFTIGTDRHWRGTVAQPPHPVTSGNTTTYCKGSLFWAVDVQRVHMEDDDEATHGLVCFSLEDESFSVVRTPRRMNQRCCLAELRGELCVAHLEPEGQTLELWMCDSFVGGTNPPQWYKRDVINLFMYSYQRSPRPLAMSREGNILFEYASSLSCYDALIRQFKDLVWMKMLRFQDPDKGKGTFIDKYYVSSFDVIPYIPSLVPI